MKKKQKQSSKPAEPKRAYKVVVSGNAWVSTTYYLLARSPEEAEAMAKSGDHACESEEVVEKSDTDCEVTEA